jgi:hypothetical protein
LEASCYDSSTEHAEMRTEERVLDAARAYQEDLTFEEAKRRVLEAIEECDLMGSMGVDEESGLPKYKVECRLPESRNIYISMYIIYDEENKRRMLKSIWTNFQRLSPNWRNE